MPQKFALYDKHDKLYLISSNGAEVNHTFYNVLKTATLVNVAPLTETEIRSLSLQEVIALVKTKSKKTIRKMN